MNVRRVVDDGADLAAAWIARSGIEALQLKEGDTAVLTICVDGEERVHPVCVHEGEFDDTAVIDVSLLVRMWIREEGGFLTETTCEIRALPQLECASLTLRPLSGVPMDTKELNASSFYAASIIASKKGSVVCDGSFLLIDWFNEKSLFSVSVSPDVFCSIATDMPICFASSKKSAVNVVTEREAWVSQVCSTLSPSAESHARDMIAWIETGLDCAGTSIQPERGVLIHGPAGAGKSSFAETLCVSSGLPCHRLFVRDVFRSKPGEGEMYAKTLLLETAIRTSPSFVLIDDVDALCSDRRTELASRASAHDRRICATLLSLFKRLITLPHPVFLICTTSRPKSIDSDLLAILTKKVSLGLPSTSDRLHILKARTKHLPRNDELLATVAKRSHGLLPADIESLIVEACIASSRRGQSMNEMPSLDEFLSGLSRITPMTLKTLKSRLRFREADHADVGDIDNVLEKSISLLGGLGGLFRAKRELASCLLLPFLDPDELTVWGLTPPQGVLLYGPSGCGKSALALEALGALKVGGYANVIVIDSSALISKVVGESEKNVASAFKRAREAAPCVIFFDQFATLCPIRGFDSTSERSMDRVLSVFLSEMDGIMSHQHPVVVVAAAHRREALDPAILRPGRLSKHIFLGYPDKDERADIFFQAMENTPVECAKSLKNASNELATLSEGFSCADIANAVNQAAMETLRQDSSARAVPIEHIFEMVCK